jgi:Heparinase II/III-like protein
MSGISRKEFLKLGGSSVAALASVGAFPARGALAQAWDSHPRVMLNSLDVADLRALVASEAQLSGDVSRLVSQKSSYLSAPLASASTFDKVGAENNERIITSLALMYLLDPVAHGDAGNRVVSRVLDTCTHANTANWVRQEWLQMGPSAFSVAVGYDWCYKRFTDAQRTQVESGAKTRGIDPYNAHNSSSGPLRMWHGWNWAGQINGGIGCLIRALWNETTYQTTLATAWANWESRVQRGTVWTDFEAKRYWAPLSVDGGQKEGGYLDYYIHKVLAAFATYRAHTGPDHPFWAAYAHLAVGAARFARHKVGPPDNNVGSGHNGEPLLLRFSDGSDRWVSPNEVAWVGYVAKRLNDDHIRGILQASRSWGSGPPPVTGVLGAQRIVWYEGRGTQPTANGEPRDALYRDTTIWSARSSWTDPNAIYVGARVGGDVDEGHTHLDRGSFMLFGHGVDYFVDMGEDKREGGNPYSAGGEYDNFFVPTEENGNRWRFPRLRASGHNTLVINPDNSPDQRVGVQTRSWASPTIEKHAEEVASPYCVTNLTPLYTGRAPWTNVTSVRRGLKFDSRNKLIVQDEIKASANLDVWALMHTRRPGAGASSITFASSNKVAIVAARGADNRRCYCRILAPTSAVFAKRAYGALPGVTYLYSGTNIEDNSDRETLYVKLSGQSSYRLVVMLMPLADGQADATTFPGVVALDNW